MTPAADDVRRQLDRLLASPGFANAGRMSRFLKFVVERTLAGEGDRLKEYVIGVEVFDRGASYDPRVDAIVRVEAARLRAKLAEYYAGDGRDDPVVLTLPKGGYAPAVELHPTSGAQARALNGSATHAGALRRARGWLAAAVLAGAATLAVAVWAPWSSVASLPDLRVAVLPFAPYPDGGAALEAAALRVTEGVTAELVSEGRFAVVASSAARAAARPGLRPRDVAAALDADVLVEARLTLDGERALVEARLSSGALEQKLWVRSFAGSIADSDALEREIAAALTAALSTAGAPPK